MNIQRVLIANRGEIALRIIKSLKKSGVECVAVFHEDETPAKHIQAAHRAISLGGGSLADTYLNIDKIIHIAKTFKVDAIHPGYGFLSENPDFARACIRAEIEFIGPSPEALEQLAHKANAKEIAVKSGVPVLESTLLKTSSEVDISKLVFPVLIKAVAGGGGKGMKIVRDANAFVSACESAAREARQYFADDTLMLEPYLEHARHIEVQILADKHGNYHQLLERECSTQRNYQKIIEEAPADSISADLKQKLYTAAIEIAKAVGYVNAGTVEFLVAGDEFYFLEMNARIQVEHPVTEAITGVDLVDLQLRVARNERITTLVPHQPTAEHAIELRLYAEQPEKNFAPSTGKLSLVRFPENIRVDTFIDANTQITSLFDGMLAKIIVTGYSRTEAIQNSISALEQTHIHGVRTNLMYLLAILKSHPYRSNVIHTRFLEDFSMGYCAKKTEPSTNALLIMAFIARNYIPKSPPINPWLNNASWYVNRWLSVYIDEVLHEFQFQYDKQFITLKTRDESTFTSELLSINECQIDLLVNEALVQVNYSSPRGKTYDYYELDQSICKVRSSHLLHQASIEKSADETTESYNGKVLSPLFGKVIEVHKKTHDRVNKGEVLITIESMKTENHILAPFHANIDEVFVEPGMQIEENKQLISLIPIE